jgi:hypothetical protein
MTLDPALDPTLDTGLDLVLVPDLKTEKFLINQNLILKM